MWKVRHEMSVEEIARELGVSERSVKQSLKRAMKKLRDGRAEKFRDLMIAREKERNYGLPTISLVKE